jgi:hypothetical protein
MKISFIATYSVVTEEKQVVAIVAETNFIAKRMVAASVDGDVLVAYAGDSVKGMKEESARVWYAKMPVTGKLIHCDVNAVLTTIKEA